MQCSIRNSNVENLPCQINNAGLARKFRKPTAYHTYDLFYVLVEGTIHFMIVRAGKNICAFQVFVFYFGRIKKKHNPFAPDKTSICKRDEAGSLRLACAEGKGGSYYNNCCQ